MKKLFKAFYNDFSKTGIKVAHVDGTQNTVWFVSEYELREIVY